MIDSMGVHHQLIRYAVVGITSNAIIYLFYLLATWLGLGPKTAMTGLYVVGVMQTFIFNKKWSFRFAGAAAEYFMARSSFDDLLRIKVQAPVTP